MQQEFTSLLRETCRGDPLVTAGAEVCNGPRVAEGVSTGRSTESNEPEINTGWPHNSGRAELGRQNTTIGASLAIARVMYTGGYVLPGTTPGPGQAPLPDDLEHAAVEQVAFWFQNRDRIALRISWPSNGEYRQIAAYDLLHSVTAFLARHTRY